MSNSRRKFISHTGLTLAGMALAPELFTNQNPVDNNFFDTQLTNDDFWEWVRQSYTIHANIINLNNGGVSPQPKVVQEVFEHYNRYSNEAPSYFMWRILDKSREPLRKDLAAFAGCHPEEISICRNSSEALETIIFGLSLQKGDEVLVTNYDYPNMRNAWLQRQMREGIKLNWIDIPIGLDDNDKIVKLYTDAITSKTKIVHLTHVINWTGHILPARQICEEAHKKGVEVILDAAHSLAHIEMNLHEIDCDYAGFSLHKWLCAPFGTGMLYVKQNKIENLWPLFAPEKPKENNIRKFEALGTRSFPAEMAIGRALSFHNSIGTKRKEERLRYLKNYWVEKVKSHPKIKFYSPLSNHASCAIATVGIEGKKAHEIENFLLEKYGVHCVSIEWQKVNGVRITPHVYTSTDDLDKLVKGLTELAG
jgi:selenocysteine lyase/cysteine desulfurase